MNLSVRTDGPWQHILDIEVPVDEVERRMEEVSQQIQRRATLPGFRRGRVPLDLVRQHFAEALESEFLETFVPRIAGEAVDQARLSPLIPPLVKNIRFTPGSPLAFEVEVHVKPDVEVRDYRGIHVKRRVRTVDDEAVARVLEGLRDDAAVFVDLDRPAERGDVVLLDSTRLDANGRRLASSRLKNRRIQLGAPDLLPDLENGLLGIGAGQERTFDVHYPAEYPAAELAGKTARYVVKARKIQEKKLRELDDTLARDVFQLGSLEELKSRIRLNLEGEEHVRVQREMEATVVDELVRRHPVELAERIVQWMLDRVITEAVGQRAIPDAMRRELEARYRPGVERSLKREILLDAVARQEKLEASDEDVAREIERMVQADPKQAARLRARYQSTDRRQGLKESLRERKALDWLISVAEVDEEVLSEPPMVLPGVR
jgi:trigger factor